MTTNPIPPPPPEGYDSWLDIVLYQRATFAVGSDLDAALYACAELADLRRQRDEMRELLRNKRLSVHGATCSFYRQPLAPCNCGTSEWNARVAKALGEEPAR